MSKANKKARLNNSKAKSFEETYDEYAGPSEPSSKEWEENVDWKSMAEAKQAEINLVTSTLNEVLILVSNLKSSLDEKAELLNHRGQVTRKKAQALVDEAKNKTKAKKDAANKQKEKEAASATPPPNPSEPQPPPEK